MQKFNEIKSFGFLYSRRCPAQCKHCGTSSTPFYKGTLSIEIIEKILKALPKYNINSIGISGGEPLLYYKEMLHIGKIAKKHQIGITLFSNAFWAKNSTVATEYLSNLKENSLTSLQLSTDEFHQEFIHLKNIINASNVANSLDIPCTIMIPSKASGWSTINTVSYLEMECNAEIITHPIHPIGRALELDDSYFQWRDLEIEGCELVGQIEVDTTGETAICPPASDFDETNPLIVGNLKSSSVDDAVERFQNRLLYWVLGNYGPLGLYYLFIESGVEVTAKIDGKISNCQLCQQLTSNKSYFKDFMTLEKINLKEDNSITLENQKRCHEIINKSQKRNLNE